jgi:DNA processing protein
MITRELVSAECCIVSGLALGVDAVAHQTALQQSGKTIAVLGCGVDLCYPSTNQSIYNSILFSGGSIVSEYPPGQPPSVGSFPSRNRIIAGLSNAIVVTEGAEDSGSLITAREAIKNGRKVFAVPGPITSGLSKGPLKLLREGAVMVTSGEDILEELEIAKRKLPMTKRKKIIGETKEEQEIIDALRDEGMLFDDLVRLLHMSPTVLATRITLLEMRGIVRNSAGKFHLVSS